MKRVWVVIQRSDDLIFQDADVVGVYTTPEQAEFVKNNCLMLYKQHYYIQDVELDFNPVLLVE